MSDPAILDMLREAEEALRETFGTETFKIDGSQVEMRTSGGDTSLDFDEFGPKKRRQRLRVTAFKDDYPGIPYPSQNLTWLAEGESLKMKIDRVRGREKSAVLWTLELVEI